MHKTMDLMASLHAGALAVDCRYWVVPPAYGQDRILEKCYDYRGKPGESPYRPFIPMYMECKAFKYVDPRTGQEGYAKAFELGPPVHLGALYTLDELKDLAMAGLPEWWLHDNPPNFYAAKLMYQEQESIMIHKGGFHVVLPGDLIDPENWE